GPFTVNDALSLEQIREIAVFDDGYEQLDKYLLATDTALVDLPGVHLTGDSAFYVKRGQAVCVPDAPRSGLVRLYVSPSQFIGVGAVLDDGRIAPRRLMR
ncbi:MAG: tRNA pseudouridine(55) synthase TruB, partial [Gammaproteobacteria bacterium]